jgi:hypothetical protein
VVNPPFCDGEVSSYPFFYATTSTPPYDTVVMVNHPFDAEEVYRLFFDEVVSGPLYGGVENLPPYVMVGMNHLMVLWVENDRDVNNVLEESHVGDGRYCTCLGVVLKIDGVSEFWNRPNHPSLN